MVFTTYFLSHIPLFSHKIGDGQPMFLGLLSWVSALDKLVSPDMRWHLVGDDELHQRDLSAINPT